MAMRQYWVILMMLILCCIIFIFQTYYFLYKGIVDSDVIPSLPQFKFTHHQKHELLPEFQLSTVKENVDNCYYNDRVIELNFGKAGMTDRTGKIVLLAGIACHLDAKIPVPRS
jgi:hypothetical protein